jgi:hypothetical protein
MVNQRCLEVVKRSYHNPQASYNLPMNVIPMVGKANARSSLSIQPMNSQCEIVNLFR